MDIIDILYYIIDVVSSFLSLGNILVIILVVQFEYLKTKQNAFIVLLAISDAIYGLIVTPSSYILNATQPDTNITSYSMYESWFAACKFRCFFNTLGECNISYYLLPGYLKRPCQ